jgi:hypothetical protein
MSLTNARLDPRIETVFLMADGEYSHVSSSLIRQIASLGGGDSLNLFVPPECIGPILEKSGYLHHPFKENTISAETFRPDAEMRLKENQ